jgi:hypothetical protein
VSGSRSVPVPFIDASLLRSVRFWMVRRQVPGRNFPRHEFLTARFPVPDAV